MKSLDNAHILLHDNHLLAVYKEAGIATQPDLVDRAKAWVKKRYAKPGAVFLEPIHRLDRVACGIVLFARTSKALSRLQESMRKKEIQKTYRALVEGCVAQKRGTLRHFLTHGEYRAEVKPEGKESILHYEVVGQEGGNTWVQIDLETGRYHQIRAQFAAVGHPVVGDRKYGSTQGWKGEGIALCHERMEFKHPVTGEVVRVVCSELA